MVDYLETGNWISPRDALPPEGQNVLALVNGHPVIVYMVSSVWYRHNWPGLQTPTIGYTQAVDRWMHIPPVGSQPEVQVLVEALGANINDVSMRREDMRQVGDLLAMFSGATINFDGAFDRVGPIDSRSIARLRLIAEYA